MRAIIHIGNEKTGSTSIQVWKNTNRSALAERGVATLNAPVDMPDLNLHLAGAVLAHEAMNAPDDIAFSRVGPRLKANRQAVMQKLRRELETCLSDKRLFFASCEHLFSYKDPQIQGVHAFLDGYFSDVKIVLYLRDPVSWIESFYSQAIRSGLTVSFDEFFEARYQQLARGNGYLQQIDLWESVFPGQLDVRVMHPSHLVDGDLIADVANLLTVPLMERPGSNNASLDMTYLEYLRQINIDFPRDQMRQGDLALRRAAFRAAEKLSDPKRRVRCSAEQAARLDALLEASSSEINARYVKSAEPLFSCTRSDPGSTPAPLSEESKLELDGLIGREVMNTLRNRQILQTQRSSGQ